MRTESNLSNSYTENEIYQHITNCQIFLSYNADETKLLKRRKAFRDSMAFLTNLTQRGNIDEANQWGITHAIFGRRQTNPMTELGFYIAQKVLEYESDAGKAASILLLICLDFAYNSVVSVSDARSFICYNANMLQFTAVLDDFMTDLYKVADLPADEATAGDKPKWIKAQTLAFSDAPGAQTELEKMIQATSQATVKLPILRTAVEPYTSSKVGKVVKGQTVILDLVSSSTLSFFHRCHLLIYSIE